MCVRVDGAKRKVNRGGGMDGPKNEANPSSNESGGHGRQALAIKKVKRIPNKGAWMRGSKRKKMNVFVVDCLL